MHTTGTQGTKPEILAIGPFPDCTLTELNERFRVHHFSKLPTHDDIPLIVATRIRAVATVTIYGIPRTLLDRLPNVEVVCVFGVGADAVDLIATRERAIPVTNTPDIVAPEVADLAIGMMLASARNIVHGDHYARSGDWGKKGPIALGRSVGNKICGIVGLGAIGTAIATRATALRMKVLYTSRSEKRKVNYEFVASLPELARRSDFLMVACTGGPDTQNLISREIIQALGPTGTLINVSRGSVVDEEALIECLSNKSLGYAALDVYANEPHFDNRLRNFQNVILQPHHATAVLEARIAMGQLVVDNLVAHFGNAPLLTPIRR